MSMRRLPCLLLLATWLPLASPAQSPPLTPASLEELRLSFQQRVRLASGSLNDYYEKALASLETSLAALGDYEQARAVKARRADLAALSASAPTPSPGLSLLPEKARLTGSVLATTDSLQGWRTSSCTAEWILPRFTPGLYQVQLTYLMAARKPVVSSPSAPPPRVPEIPSEQVPFLFRESSLLASAAKNSLPLTLDMTAASEFKPITLAGSIELTRAPVVLQLLSKAACPLNEIIIRELKLIPVNAAAAPVPSAAAAPELPLAEQLKQLQLAQAGKMAAAQKPVIETYLASLAALSAPLPEAAEAIAQEQQRVRKLQEGKSPKRPAGLRLDNFEELSDAHFVPDPSNTGDTFKIEHQGQQRRIRLAWVSCAPLDPAEQRALKLTQERFGITAEAALSLARDAQEFTALYLEGRPLRLLLRQDRKDTDVPQALLFVENIGLFQNVLVDHGLAAVDLPGGKDRNPLENSLLSGLQEREAQARKHVPPPGGWGLRTPP